MNAPVRPNRPRFPIDARLVASGLGLLLAIAACEPEPVLSPSTPPSTEAQRSMKQLRTLAGASLLEGEEGATVAVSPSLQGRILTASVGKVASTGWVGEAAIQSGERDVAFNNFGGADRFWLGPEAGRYGLYFPPGSEFTRATWVVPRDLDRGAFEVRASSPGQISLSRTVEAVNWLGTRFRVRVDREIGIVPSKNLASEIRVSRPPDVSYVGYYSLNAITNLDDRAHEPSTGLIGIWILGMFEATSRTAIIAPTRPGDDATLGPRFNDDYFGKVSELSPERIALVGDAVVFRADASRVGKFGLSQARTTGLAGAYDFSRDLLTIVRFDVPDEPALYGDARWVLDPPKAWAGDAFQAYNHGVADRPGERAPEPFFELESASPVRELAPRESLRHRHATFHFQGPRARLEPIVRSVLGVELAAVEKALAL
jgi:hypothetical protein